MNRLANEQSPYLRQHADNPVDWYPWGDMAFDLAASTDRPVFLSVGYSACHWCHVMAHESFEDPETARVMNEGFISVKVDREERPDVDAVYMEAVQVMTGHGGWPMSVFLTPDRLPFFGGTYFPPTEIRSLPSFRMVLDAVTAAWGSRRAELESQARELADAVARRSTLPVPGTVTEAMNIPGADQAANLPTRLFPTAKEELRRRFDNRNGGFSPAPKFPQPALVELCLQLHRLTGDPYVLEMATGTLGAMAAGGIYDHVGGGFARYSTEETWTVPHFEKMLYDQAGLTRAYLHAWLATKDPQWLQVVQETIEYVLRDLRDPSGGICSAEDADSDGIEGLFYVWSRQDIDEALDRTLAEAVASWWGVTTEGNFEGKSILRRPNGSTIIRPAEVEKARVRLLEVRSLRTRPALDDKVITEWNAMFCSALAEASAATGNEKWRARATEIAEMLWTSLRRPDGRWLRSWRRGLSHHLAVASDYAWLVDCFTRLAELTGRALWLDRASATATELLRLFRSEDGTGPLFTTGSDGEELLVRPMDLFDGATSSANSVAAIALLRLGALSSDTGFTEAGQQIVESMAPVAAEHPLAMANIVAASQLIDGGITEVVIAGDRADLNDLYFSRFEPTSVIAWGERSKSPLWSDRLDGFAYVCRRYTCQAPSADSQMLETSLEFERNSDSKKLRSITI